MNKKDPLILMALGTLATTLLVYVAVSLWSNDKVFSIVPGWRTTIYPPDITRPILIIVILIVSLLVYLIFKGSIKLLILLWAKLNHNLFSK